MGIFKFVAAATLVVSLAGCDYLNNDTERGLAGAATGAVVAGALGGSALTGAIIGGAAGVFCDDLRVAGCINR
ncbi:hypothetical protein [Phaeovulum sp.]|jgi:hypothetical protein|uniref:hypothetical protein n=1 Tax=Phaeovulum sp. TaxID=2934796 RepID=UPI00272FFA47|nr:hypothetical protein [Phaeovulum sp.]MDP1668522.1 hypothetical protein [Phaeovulum sp.]MDP2062572.1 hypothetical protein [Phaeovulum sp.]MDP3861005.1 hypothetical protein [Phaeovulum sp.]MDZ4118805.1 hypothetical protein [Phaeovulum sp.]